MGTSEVTTVVKNGDADLTKLKCQESSQVLSGMETLKIRSRMNTKVTSIRKLTLETYFPKHIFMSYRALRSRNIKVSAAQDFSRYFRLFSD